MKSSKYIIHLIIVLLILFPLLGGGYILSFDMIWTPSGPKPSSTNNDFIFTIIASFLICIIGSVLAQKVLLIVVVSFAIFGFAGVIKKYAKEAYFFAALFSILNPFFYTRLIAGQYYVLLGYALLPWFVASLLKFMEAPDWKRALKLLAWTVAVGFVSIHAIGFMAVIGLVALGVYGITSGREWWRQMWLLGAVAAGWIVVNLFWLIPYIRGQGQGAQVASFGGSQLQAFATTGGSVGVPLNTLLLQGFWGDSQGRYILPSSTGVLFYGAFAVLFALIAYGFWVSRREKATQAIAISALLAWIFAMGIAWPPVAGLNTFFVQHVPLWRGYREPQKWLAVLALAYAVFAARGLGALMHKLPQWRLALSSLVLLPVLITPMMLWGAGGQLVSQDYPKDWYAFNASLKAEPSNGKVLALPWHQYLTLSFANGRTVANPVPGFFDARTVVSSSNPELTGVTAQRSRDQVYVEDTLLPQRLVRTDAGAELATIGVEYVVLLKEADYAKYGWLDKQTDLKLVQNSGDLRVYKNLEYKASK